MVVEGVCLPAVLIGRIGRHGAGLVGMLFKELVLESLFFLAHRAMT